MVTLSGKDFFVLKIATACLVKAGTHQPVHTNRKNSGLAIMCNKSCEFLFENSKRIVVQQNDIIYLPKGSNYVIKSTDPGDCYAINFISSIELSDSPLLFHTNESAQFIERFKRAEVTWRNKKDGYHLKCLSILYAILYELENKYASSYLPAVRHELIQPAIDYIHENYTTELLSIASLSRMCGITPEYFRSIFRRAYGISPIKYINNLKISRAEELLKSNLYSITEVALMSGYNDLAHFSREFKKAYEMSPSVYVKRISQE